MAEEDRVTTLPLSVVSSCADEVVRGRDESDVKIVELDVIEGSTVRLAELLVEDWPSGALEEA